MLQFNVVFQVSNYELGAIPTLLYRVTSLEQFSLAEFSGEEERPKVYQNDHKNVPGIWFNLVTKFLSLALG